MNEIERETTNSKHMDMIWNQDEVTATDIINAIRVMQYLSEKYEYESIMNQRLKRNKNRRRHQRSSDRIDAGSSFGGFNVNTRDPLRERIERWRQQTTRSRLQVPNGLENVMPHLSNYIQNR